MTNIPIIFNHSILISQHESRVPPPTSHPPPTPKREADTYIQTNLTPWLHLFHYRPLRSMSNMVTAVHSYFQEESWAWRDLPYFMISSSSCPLHYVLVLFFCFVFLFFKLLSYKRIRDKRLDGTADVIILFSFICLVFVLQEKSLKVYMIQ